VCFDPTVAPASVASCERDTQCADAWRCSQPFEQQSHCIARGVGSDVRCLDDTGCEGGWRCGFSGRCFDPKAATDGGLTCERDAECPDDSRCGQRVHGVRTCLSKTVGGPNPCDDDDGCAGGWRCDTVAQVCVLVTDTVHTGSYLPPSHADLLSPHDALLGAPPPELFAMSRVEADPSGTRVGAAFGSDSGVAFVTVSGQPRVIVDGGLRFVEIRRVASQQAISTLVATPQAVYALSVAGVVVRCDVGSCATFDAGAPVVGLRQVGATGQAPRKSDALFWTRAAAFEVPVGMGPPLPSFTLLDGVSLDGVVWFHDGDGGVSVRATSVQPLARGPLPQAVSDLRAGSLTTPAGASNFGMVFKATSNGAPALGVFVAGVQGGPPILSSALWTVPQPCPFNDVVPSEVWFGAEQGSDLPSPLVRCAVPQDGGQALFRVRLRHANDGGLEPVYLSVYEDQTPYAFDAVVPMRSAPIGRAHAAREGHAWFSHPSDSPDGSVLNAPLQPLLLDRQPDAIVALDTGLVAQAGALQFNFDPGYGFVSDLRSASQVGVLPLLALPSHAKWVVTQTGVIDLRWATDQEQPRVLAQAPAGVTWTAPLSADVANFTVDGVARTVIVVAANDTVYLADVTGAQGRFAPPATFEAVVVPAPGLRLRSMTLLPAAGASVLEGYVTTNTRIWRFTSRDLLRWSLTPVAIPNMDALPVEVWDEGQRGRAGFSDGTIWSLPVMVKLGRAVKLADAGVGEVNDFVTVRGDSFAATREGVWQLVAADAGLPGWGLLGKFGADKPEGARFYSSGGRRFIATSTGLVAEIPVPDAGP
jgi:hypothetical protein